MIVTPKTRGFICTTAHPIGCAENVKQAADYAKAHKNPHTPKRVLVIGASTGYGLACRIAATFGNDADTVGVFFEKEGTEKRTATAGHYNNVAFEALAEKAGRKHPSINGDAFSKEIKEKTIAAIKNEFPGGQVDLVIYSLAAPKRTDHNGITHSSVIKPIGQSFHSKTVDFHTGEVTGVTIDPATEEELAGTVAVMGGEDWLLWMNALGDAGVLGEHVATIAFSYIGPVLTHSIYKDGTIGTAKKDLEEKAKEITTLLSPLGGKAFVSVNKGLVTQASSAIPVVPLYISLLYKIMKEKGTHENCTLQAVRLLDRMYPHAETTLADIPVDDEGRIRIDDWEMAPDVQAKVNDLWDKLTTENLEELSDIEGYRSDFFRLFGFGVEGVDYSQDVDIQI